MTASVQDRGDVIGAVPQLPFEKWADSEDCRLRGFERYDRYQRTTGKRLPGEVVANMDALLDAVDGKSEPRATNAGEASMSEVH